MAINKTKTKRPRLVILVGNIGSGKTTLAKAYAKKGYAIVSRDDMRSMLNGGRYGFKLQFEPAVHAGSRAVLQGLLGRGLNVVLDETNVSVIVRRPTIKMAKAYGYKVIGHATTYYSREICLDRRMESGRDSYSRKKWGEIWDRFDRAYETFHDSEGLDDWIIEGVPS
jgi:predicted kinase